MSSARTTQALAVLDVETTGLVPGVPGTPENPSGEGHQLLEIALKLVTPSAPYTEISPVFRRVIQHDREEMFARSEEVVQLMHTRTGLWDELATGTPLALVDLQLQQFLRQYVGRQGARPTGNSLRLDMNFIDAFLPQTANWLHYRFLDVTGLGFWLTNEFGVPPFTSTNASRVAHTASDDLENCLDELRYYRQEAQQHIAQP